MAGRQIVVDIIGDSSKFEKATNAAVTSGSKFSKQAVKGFGLGVGLGVFSLATGAVDALVGSLGDMQQAYKDDQVSVAKLGTALKNNIPNWDGNTDAVEEYAAAQGRLGFQDDEIRDSIGQLIGVTHDLTEAQELNTLAQDLARAKGIDLATATDVITKAHEGNGRALKSLGIDIGNAKTATEFLDAAQKNVKGSAEAWAATSEGKAAVANVRNAESMEKIGKVVDRVATVVLPIAAEAFSLVADVVSNVAEAVGPLIEEIVKELTPAFRTVMAFITGTVIPVLNRVAQVVLPPLRTIIGVVANAFKTHIGIMVTVITGAATIIGNIVNTITGIFNRLVGFLGGLPTRIGNAVRGMWNGILTAFKSVINAVIRGWNSLKFSLPSIDLGPLGKVGGFTIGTPNIPYLHKGGIVPGSPGSDVAAILQAGEQVIPRGEAGRNIVIQVEHFYGSDTDMERFADRLARRLATVG